MGMAQGRSTWGLSTSLREHLERSLATSPALGLKLPEYSTEGLQTIQLSVASMIP